MRFAWLLALAGWLLAVWLEVGVLASGGWPWSSMPLVLSAGVALGHAWRRPSGWWWLVAFGLLLDLWRLGPVWSQGAAWALAGAGGWQASLRLFSPRSYYGLLGAGFSTYAVLQLVLSLQWFLGNVTGSTGGIWTGFLAQMGSEVVLLLLLLTIFYAAGKRFRSFVSYPV